MTTFLAKSIAGAGTFSFKEEPLGRGGEGAVHELTAHNIPGLDAADSLVFKKYFEPEQGDRKDKIIAMLQATPESQAVAWPLAVVFTPQKTFAGYLMKKLDVKDYRMWALLAHAQDRKTNAENFDVRYALTAAKNLAIALYSVNQAGHCVGDVNESNIFVANDARVLLVDTDSAQIESASGKIYPCLVGKPEYTAPEISHGSLKDNPRTVATDVFAYGVAIFQILTGGAHPTDGIFKGDDEPPSQIERIRKGWYPSLLLESTNGGLTPVPRIATIGLPTKLRALITQCLRVNPQERPQDFIPIVKTIDEILANLEQCSITPQHWFDKRDGACGWCTHVNAGKPDPWVVAKPVKQGLPIPAQTALPTIGFGENNTPPQQAQRAPAAQAGQQAAQAYQQTVNPGAGAQPAVSPPSPRTYTQEELQKIFKTKKTVLTYTDGSHEIRPPLMKLAKSNPRVALDCFKDEMPSFARFWWSGERAVASPGGLGLTLLFGLTFALFWLIMIPQGRYYIPYGEDQVYLYNMASFIAAGGAALATIFLAFTGLVDRRRALKKYGSRVNIEPMKKTIGHSVGVSIIYGPLLVIGLIGATAIAVVELIFSILRNGTK